MTKNFSFKKVLLLTLCLMLIAAMAFFAVSCGSETNVGEEITDETNLTEIGEGAKSFTLTVVFGGDKPTEYYLVKTDEATVGKALEKLELIKTSESGGFISVDTVCGVDAIFSESKTYWCFYDNGEMATVGSFDTEILDGGSYKFVISK